MDQIILIYHFGLSSKVSIKHLLFYIYRIDKGKYFELDYHFCKSIVGSQIGLKIIGSGE